MFPSPIQARRRTHRSREFTRRRRADLVYLVGCVAVLLWGIVWGLACSGANESTRGESNQQAGAGGWEEPTKERPIRFALDDADYEMSIPMAAYDPDSSQTIISGDWFVRNFSFVAGRLRAYGDQNLPNSVALWLEHRQYDAEIVVYSWIESPEESERFLDVALDMAIGRVGNSATLIDAVIRPPNVAQPAIRDSFVQKGVVAGRPGLEAFILRNNPSTSADELIKLSVTRQQIEGGTALVYVAMRTRATDYAALNGEVQRLGDAIAFGGAGTALEINDNRELGPTSSTDWASFGVFDSPGMAAADPGTGDKSLTVTIEVLGAIVGAGYGAAMATPIEDEELPEAPLPDPDSEPSSEGTDASLPGAAPTGAIATTEPGSPIGE